MTSKEDRKKNRSSAHAKYDTIKPQVFRLLEMGFTSQQVEKMFSLFHRVDIMRTLYKMDHKSSFANPISFNRFLKYLDKQRRTPGAKNAIDLVPFIFDDNFAYAED